MNASKFNDSVRQFELAADAARLSLSQMLRDLTAGKCISTDEAEVYLKFVSAMNDHYCTAVSEAASFLSQDELPPENSPISEYVAAYHSCSNIRLQEKIRQISDILNRFLRIQSVVRSYAEALRPYQTNAERLLESLNDPALQLTDLDRSEYNLEPQELFLRCIHECADDSDETLDKREALLDRIHEFYPERRIYDGLIAGKYIIAEDQLIKHATTESYVPGVDISGENTDITSVTDSVQRDEDSAESSHGKPESIVPRETPDPAGFQVNSQIASTTEPEHNKPATETESEIYNESIETITSCETQIIEEQDSDVTESENAVSWETLDITNPDALIFTAESDTVRITVSPKENAPFGVKALKQENKKYKNCLVKVIKNVIQFGLTSPDLLSITSKSLSIDDASAAVELVFQLGYINCYQYSDHAPFYSLSARGKKIFQRQDSAKLFDMTTRQFQKWWNDSEDDPNAVLSRSIYLRTILQMLNARKSTAPLKYLPDFISHSFLHVINSFFDNKRDLMLIGITSNCPDKYQALLTELKLADFLNWSVLVVGISKAHAEAVTEWLRNAVPELRNKTDLFYLDDSDGKVYAMPDEQIPSLAEYTFDQMESSDTETTVETALSESSHINMEDSTSDTSFSPEATDIKQMEQDTVSISISAAIVSDGLQDDVYEELTDTLYTKYTDLCMQMAASGKRYCATAFLNVLAKRYPQMENYHKQFAFAYNDPLSKCHFSSDMIFDTFFSEPNPLSDYLVIAAVLRNYFYDQQAFDYNIEQLQDAISSNPLLSQNSALQTVIYQLKEFKIKYHHGIDYYADYRQKNKKALEAAVCETVSEAADIYENHIETYVKESVHQKRFLVTQTILFDKRSDIAVSLEYVRNDNRESLDLISDFLLKSVIRDGCDIEAYNIDQDKINELINKAWYEAGKQIRLEKKSSDLMGKLRNNLFKALEKIARILCRYVSLIKDCSATKDSPEQMAYAQIRTPLIKHMSDAISYYESSDGKELADLCGKQVICDTMQELIQRMDGTYNEYQQQYFYVNFLRNEWVLLDEDYLPVFDEIPELPELSVLSRIERHYLEPERFFEERMQQILEGGDDYGSAKLILDYVQHTTPQGEAVGYTAEQIEEAVSYARDGVNTKRMEFIEELELRHAYGQIDNTKIDMKESFVQIMDIWYEKSLSDYNFGFFYKILSGILEIIKKNAKSRADSLRSEISALIAEHSEIESNEQTKNVLEKIRSRIDVQNYAAAEDLLNRLLANDVESTDSYIENDYLQDFLKHYQIYTNKAGDAGKTLRSMAVHNKDIKGGNRLFESWSAPGFATEEGIKRLLLALGFNIDSVVLQKPIKDKKSFFASLSHPDKQMKNAYTHPISAFGSEAEDNGFRIVPVLGKMDATRLIDLMEQIGSAYNTIILLDYSLNLPDRRELARKTKSLHLGKTVLVIDRLVIVYLANHYSDNAVNRMLMALTVPFSSCQPYVYDSAHVMPPEIFMGRRKELDKIKSPQGVHIVYGGRQLGKSALLRKAKTDINNTENQRAVLVDIKGKDYKAAARKISEALIDEGILNDASPTEDWEQIARMLKNRLRENAEGRKISYLLLLLDEADAFIDSCSQVDYKPFDELKDIESIGENRFKFVIAGLRNIVRFKKNIALSNNHVLTHLSAMTIMPFKSTEARELLEVPLSYLGFRFLQDEKTETLISTIFGTTNYFPGLLQLYCAKLVESLHKNYAGYNESDTPPYVLKEEQIKKVLADSTLVEQIREKFIITLKVDDDNYYYLIALLAAYNYHSSNGRNGSGAAEIKELAEFYEISKITQLTVEQVDALMEEMRELNVFQKISNGKYRFARLSFCQMMGNKRQIEDEIIEYAVENGG